LLGGPALMNFPVQVRSPWPWSRCLALAALVGVIPMAPRRAIAADPPAAPRETIAPEPGSTPPGSAPLPTPVEPTPVAPLEVTVLGDRAPGSISVGKGEVRVLPGAFGDPFRAIEALPGVTPMTSGLPYFYVRGAPPGNVGYFLDGVRIPALFHLLAGPSVLPGSLLRGVELFPGGYPAEYGRYTGGVVVAQTRPPSTDFRAEGVLRLVDAGAVVEAPLPGGLGSALAGARYSYTAPIVSLFVPDLRLAYWDYQGRVALDLSPHGRLTVLVFGSHDDSEQRKLGVWTPMFATEFHRVDVRYEATLGERTRVQEAVTLGMDRSRGSFGDMGSPAVKSSSVAARVAVEHRASDALLVRAGLDATLEAYAFDRSALGNVADVGLFPSRQDLAVGFHADAVIDAGHGVQLTPGARVDLWGSQGSTAVTADVRFAARVPVTPRVRLVDAVGLAHQAPGFLLQVPGVAIGGLAGGLQRSFQTSGGVEADLPLGITASATFFYNAFFNFSDPFGTVVDGSAQNFTPTGVPSLTVFNQRALGSAVGMEIYVRRRLTERLGGFLAYTLSRSSRQVDGTWFAAHLDRTHVLNAALSWDIGSGFRVGARLAVSSGTPLTHFYPAPWIALAGSGPREPAFARLDVRAEKRWTLGSRGWIAVVLEGQNVTLSREPAGIECYSSPRPGCAPATVGPVTIPSLGIEGGV
jgi:hypothetical protein